MITMIINTLPSNVPRMEVSDFRWKLRPWHCDTSHSLILIDWLVLLSLDNCPRVYFNTAEYKKPEGLLLSVSKSEYLL